MFKSNLNKQKGFTLVEMIVALGIFTVVAVIAVGALLKVVDLNKRAFSLKTEINNVNFALESMSREMRVGRNYFCFAADVLNPSTSNVPNPLTIPSDDCPTITTTAWVLAFNSSKGCTDVIDRNVIYAYRFNPVTKVLQKAQQDPNNCLNDQILGSDFSDVTSGELEITNSFVNVIVTDQPRAFFWFKGFAGIRDKDKTVFNIQTTVSQRIR